MIKYNAKILKNEILTDNLFILSVIPDSPLDDFQAGQFTTLGLKAKEKRHGNTPDPKGQKDPEKMIRRAYSILSSPEQKGQLDFYIALVNEGELTPRLFVLKEGDALFMGNKITGKFTLDKTPGYKHLLLISTGTGITPFMSMMAAHFDQNPERHWLLTHGVRHSQDLSFHNDLTKQHFENNNFHYLPLVSRPQEDSEWTGETGRVTIIDKERIEKETGKLFTPDQFDVFLCGNPAMIEEMTTTFETLGFKKDQGKEVGQIHIEEYW